MSFKSFIKPPLKKIVYLNSLMFARITMTVFFTTTRPYFTAMTVMPADFAVH